ncbi:Phosphoenolpyruvate-protein phosphotransferase [Caulifigura coniformis]|uniref:Phosphoenolpyruvate-protein phosphotransferase n=1 Tax=Caulifigura coniformis TaxID=2527983 RepID=A0A517SK84_9PLAN|nr:phosphoenolpyruvate--protein phosphotransferase [Caulifigura coniformis]QDT56521.1 Phosphoenolpyruvate-protein phosphotransferase [Caulifigura coniformis]
MLVKRGIAVAPGIAIGPALILGADVFRIPQRFVSVDAVDSELDRLRVALNAACHEIEHNEQLAREHLGEQYSGIFAAHLQLLRDPKLVGEIEGLVSNRHYSPEYASSFVLKRHARQLQNLGNKYLAERVHDLLDLERNLTRHLLGERRGELEHINQPVIVLAHNLTPSETANLNRNFVHGFATEVGGHTSHTAILAGALEIPAIVGIGSFLNEISGGETVIIDGHQGEVIIEPDEATLIEYREAEKEATTKRAKLRSQGAGEAITKDGVRIHISGNIEFPDEAEHCVELGADGIGLYRTEFLYMESNAHRTEEEHFQAYCQVVRTMGERPVVIRTLDLGADKVPGMMKDVFSDATNPELGLRSIRVCLADLKLFRTQLRAILRAAVEGDVRIMFPLVASLTELRQARMLLRDVVEDLEDQGIPFRRDVPVGMMVEVPSAAIRAEEFAREVDFFSIGTNDLIQYTLAADRSDPAVAKYYNTADPAILKLIRMVVTAAADARIPVTVCGQMSSDIKFVPLLIGMGLRHLSVTPQAVPVLKDLVRNMTIGQAEEIAKRVADFEIARDIESYLRGELKKLSPDSAG